MPRLRETRAERALEAFYRDEPFVVAVDTETTGLGYYDRPFAATVTWRGPDGLESHYFELDGRPQPELRAILGVTPCLVFHNAKFDLHKLIQVGLLERDDLHARRVEDTETLAHLLDENRSKALKSLAVEELGYDDTIEVEIKSGPRKGQMKQVPREKHELDSARRKLKLTKDDGYEPLPRRVVMPYALRDTEFTLLLWEKLRPQIAGTPLVDLYEREMELCLCLLDIEANGMGVDVEVLEELRSEYTAERFEAELELREAAGMPDMNPNSWQQLQAALDAAGVKVESTDEATLKKVEHPVARAVLRFRHANKILTAWVGHMLREQRGGVWHPWFRGNGARTGRMSSSSASA